MKKDNLISIIIPTYKRVIKLKKALNSILKQKYDNWEAIVIDNKSNDGTKELVKEYNDKIFFYEIENNGIIAKSRNFGISKAKGNYLAFLDSDDWWERDKLEKTNYYINKGYNFLYHDMYVVKNNTIFKKKTSYCRHLKKKIYEDLINNGPAFPTSSVVINKELFNNIENFDEDPRLVTWEDYDAWIRFSKINENFFKVPGALGCIKIGDDNALNADKLRDNIHNFNLKYIKENKMPEWCIFSLLRLSVIKKDFLKAKQYFNDLNFFDLSFSNKIRFLVFKIFVFLKI